MLEISDRTLERWLNDARYESYRGVAQTGSPGRPGWFLVRALVKTMPCVVGLSGGCGSSRFAARLDGKSVCWPRTWHFLGEIWLRIARKDALKGQQMQTRTQCRDIKDYIN
jgi:hypothetical protein